MKIYEAAQNRLVLLRLDDLARSPSRCLASLFTAFLPDSTQSLAIDVLYFGASNYTDLLSGRFQ